MQIRIRHIIRTALTGTIASMVHFYQHESHTIWMVISSLFMVQIPEVNTRIEIITVAIDRIISTAIGIFLGLLGYGMIFYFVQDGNVELMAAIIFLTFALTDSCQQATTSLTIINVTAAIIMLMSIQSNAAIEHAFARSIDIILGAGIGLITTCLIPPKKRDQ